MSIALYSLAAKPPLPENTLSATPSPTRPKAPAEPAEHEPFVGLRVRLWLGCVAGGAIAGLGTMWVLGTRAAAAAAGTGELHAWLAAVAFVAVVAGMLLAFWLDHHVVGHLRGLLRGLHSGRVAELRGLPSGAGWGELSELTEVAQGMLVRQRNSASAAQDLEQLRTQLAALQAAVDRWQRTEAWEAPALAGGPLTEIDDHAPPLQSHVSARFVVAVFVSSPPNMTISLPMVAVAPPKRAAGPVVASWLQVEPVHAHVSP